MEMVTMEQAQNYGPSAAIMDAKELKAAIAQLKSIAVTKKATIPILGGMLISASGGRATISATDLAVGVTVKVKARGTVTLVVHLAELEAALVTSKGGSVVLFRGNTVESVVVVCEGHRVLVTGFDPISFPELPTPPTAIAPAFEVDATTLKSVLTEIMPCISKEAGRFTLDGAKLVTMPRLGIVRLVSTDGHRLAYREWDCECTAFEGLVSKKALTFMGKMTGTLKVWRDEQHVFVDNGQTTMISRLLDGTFPDYIRVIPIINDDWRTARVNREGLLVAAQGALAMLKVAGSRSNPLQLSLNGKAMVSAAVDERKFGSTALATWNGPTDTAINMNAEYLVDVLKAMSADTVVINVRPMQPKGENRWTTSSAICINASGVVRGITVIMPMRD